MNEDQIEVRLFATFRQGREKIILLPAKEHLDARSVLQFLEIPEEEVKILLVNGFHSKPDVPIAPGDVIALFPPVGGG